MATYYTYNITVNGEDVDEVWYGDDEVLRMTVNGTDYIHKTVDNSYTLRPTLYITWGAEGMSDDGNMETSSDSDVTAHVRTKTPITYRIGLSGGTLVSASGTIQLTCTGSVDKASGSGTEELVSATPETLYINSTSGTAVDHVINLGLANAPNLMRDYWNTCTRHFYVTLTLSGSMTLTASVHGQTVSWTCSFDNTTVDIGTMEGKYEPTGTYTTMRAISDSSVSGTTDSVHDRYQEY